MKPNKLIGALVTSCLVAGLVTANAPSPALASGGSQGNLRVYVSPDGDDASEKGNRGHPFATIQRAADHLAEHKNADKTAQVLVLDGQYRIDEPIELTRAHSGITITAAPDASPELVGSDRLVPEKFTSVAEIEELSGKFESANRIPVEHREHVLAYDLGADGLPVGEIKKNGFNWNTNTYPPELVVDGAHQTLARYPNKVDGETVFIPRGPITYAYQPRGSLIPRENFQDKVAGNDPDLAMTFEEMLQLPAPRFKVNNASLAARISTWAAPTTALEKTWPDNQVGTKPLKTEEAEVLAAQDPTTYETDAWLSGYLGLEWADDMLQIYSYDAGDDTFRARLPSMYTNFVHQVFGENILSELDAPGEFYVDRWNGNDVLYYYPEEGSDLSDVSWKAYDGSFFELTGTSNVTISGLKMRDTLGSAIEILDGESNLIDGVEISGTGGDAITIGQNEGLITASPDYHTVRGGHDNRVENSYLHDLGAGGILLGGGDRKSLQPGNNSARHNRIENFSRLGTYMPAGYLYGVGNAFEFNEVSGSPHMAIQVMGNDMSIKFNHIKDVLKTTSDMGAIYAGRDWTYLGNEIAYNVVEDITPAGHANQAVYLDDNASGFNIHDNLFLNPGNRGVFLNKSRNISVEDNITFWDTARTAGSREWIREWSNYRGPGTGPGIENPWTLVTRFQDMLTTGDDVDAVAPKGYEATFGNTAENIATWKQHYAEVSPRIATPDEPRGSGFYVPRTAAGVICTSYTGDGECDEAGTWLNPNSIYASLADSFIHDNVASHGGAGHFGSNRYPGGGSYFNGPRHNRELFLPSSNAGIDAMEFDTENWTLGEGSSLADAAGFGEPWVQRWNAIFSYAKAHVGPVTGPVDREAFQAAVDVAEEIDVSNRPAHVVDRFLAALDRARAVAADDDADWRAFDGALIDLLDALVVVAKAPYVEAALGIVGEPLTIQAFRMQPGTATVLFDDTPVGTLEITGNGAGTGQVIVPDGFDGEVTLTVRSGATEASTQVTVLADAGLEVPETGQVGRQLRVDATGFVPNERVTFTVGGQPVETIARERYADEDGVFAGYVFVPASHATGQDVTVTGVGQSSGRSYSATTTLVVPDTFAKIESAVASSTHEPSKVVSNTFDGSRTTAWWSKQGDFPTNRPTVTYPSTSRRASAR
ncbi:right-handed parallel beta-helix repeat-containing protein [Nitriliruptor alkaliphilus]|uniref:right-handed parallel beta-helix repeat-containing protein n=1 Tax=Nitriliruptor alkaliphilus TaxID=427918 RepID=UPI0006969259|nr:right-handed parallel beta-helix repeat-containing protein [Nitriliruptor alkaliphilus]